MAEKKKVAILVTHTLAHSIFTKEALECLATVADFNSIEDLPDQITGSFMEETLPGADACITCWGTPAFTEKMLADTPTLRLIAHAAGAVRNLVPKAFWAMQGRHITSNAPVIAEDVAQTTLALILTSLKQMWDFNALTHEGGWKGGEKNVYTTRRLDGMNVGIIGCSLVGKQVIDILRPFRPVIRVWDPYLTDIEARMLGVERLPLDELIATSEVLTLHAPANPDCRHILNTKNIPLIPDNALLINTARGMLIDEPAMIRELQTGRFFACFDVTDPEPPAVDHPYRSMRNVVLTPHMAGGHTIQGRHMLGENAVKEVVNYLTKGLIAYEVREEMLGHMA